MSLKSRQLCVGTVDSPLVLCPRIRDYVDVHFEFVSPIGSPRHCNQTDWFVIAYLLSVSSSLVLVGALEHFGFD